MDSSARFDLFLKNGGRAFAIIKPIPLVPPVTSATRPLTEKRVFSFVDAMFEAEGGWSWGMADGDADGEPSEA